MIQRNVLIWIGFLLLTCTSQGHVVEQLFLSLEKAGSEWELQATFDAGYALPELRADKDAPQPQREWLYQLNEQEHNRLRKEAEAYLRESLHFTHNDTPAEFEISFPDYNRIPPEFPTMLNGGAYFTILLRGKLTDTGEFQIHVAGEPRPDFVIASGPENERQYHIITPGNSTALFTTTGPGSDAQLKSSSLFTILWMGYRHVMPDGLDHVFFILALFLMARRWQPLLAQSLTFTLAHSITLGLASSGTIQLSQWPGAELIEPLIALSIAVVALENLWTNNNSRHRLLIVFLFGLIHGLGFAGSLGTALDHGNHHNLTALIVANLGVELAQVTLLAAAWLLTSRWWQSEYYPKFRTLASLAIGITGLCWFVDRLLG